MAAVQRFIEEHGAFLDDLEQQLGTAHDQLRPVASA